MSEEKENLVDNLRELVSGGWIMLFIFGGTLCFLATASLLAIIFMKSGTPPEVVNAKVSLFKEVLSGLIGFIGGAYTTMWNNQHFKNDVKKENGNGKENIAVSVSAEPGAASASAGPSS